MVANTSSPVSSAFTVARIVQVRGLPIVVVLLATVILEPSRENPGTEFCNVIVGFTSLVYMISSPILASN